nr:hypothetical protein [Burkholderia glumae]
MDARRVAGGRRVAGADRGGDRRVLLAHLAREILARRLVAARDHHARFEVLVQEAQGLQEIGVAGDGGDRAVKRDVLGHAVAARGHGRVDLREGCVDALQVGVGAALRGLGGHLGLDCPAQREQVHERARSHRLRVVDPQWPDRAVLRDEHAAALARLDHAFVLEPRDRLADHRAAHAELLRQHGFGRQLAGAGEAADLDLPEQLLRDGVAHRARRDFLEHEASGFVG